MRDESETWDFASSGAAPVAARDSRDKEREDVKMHAKFLLAVSILLVSLGATQAAADTAPTVAIDAPSSVTYTSAHLSGTVNPNGGPSEAAWHFEYSTDNASWNQVGGGSAGSGNAPVEVSTELEGLSAGTEYFVRLVAGNDAGEATSAEPNPSFTTVAYPAPEASIEPVQLSGLDAHFSGAVDANGIETEYRFELSVDDGSPNWTTVGSGSSNDSEPVSVEADRSVAAETDYLVRLVASSKGGEATAVESFSTGTAPPSVRVLPGSGRTTTDVRLNAMINPNGLPTTYHFEWGLTTAYGNLIPSSGAEAYGGQGGAAVRYTKPISGLAPGTTVHYRVIAENAEGVVTSADQTVATLTQPIGYEMVSPANKEGNNLFFCCTARVSEDGDRATYMSAGVFAGGTSSNLQFNPYLSTRGAADWATEFLPLPQTTKNGGFTNGGTQGFSTELTKVFQFSRDALLPGAVADNANMYLHDLVTGELSFVGTFENKGFGMGISEANIFQGSTPNGDHMVFRSDEPLTAGAPKGDGFYSGSFYDFFEDELHLVSVLPNGDPVLAQPFGPPGYRLKANPVSADGSRIFFNAQSQLYMREDATTTIQISASQRNGADPNKQPTVNLGAWATPDGSVVFFVAFAGEGKEGLTDDAPDFVDQGEGQLYRYDVESGDLAYVGFGSDGPPDTNFVNRILGVSDDGSTVYFTGGYSDGESSSSFSPSTRIYVSRNGTTHFVAAADIQAESEIRDGQVTADGRYLAITSLDTGLVSPAANTCAGCPQIFVYDDNQPDAGFRCASCNPNGEKTSATELRFEPEQNLGSNLNRVIADDGTVFFQSEDSLVPEDTNGKVDIYWWRAGQLDLVSRGHGKENSFYASVTPDGSSVFFYTGEQLVSQDVDDAQDLYVARVGGGLPKQNPPLPEPPCFGEGCLDRSPDPPADVTPGSNGFQGPPNPKPTFSHRKRCGKAAKRKVVHGKVKCVKKRAHHSKGGHR